MSSLCFGSLPLIAYSCLEVMGRRRKKKLNLLKVRSSTDPWATTEFQLNFFIYLICFKFTAQNSRLYFHQSYGMHFVFYYLLYDTFRLRRQFMFNASSDIQIVLFLFFFFFHFCLFGRLIWHFSINCRYTFCKKLYIKLKFFSTRSPPSLSLSFSFVILTLFVLFLELEYFFFLFFSKRNLYICQNKNKNKNRFPLF